VVDVEMKNEQIWWHFAAVSPYILFWYSTYVTPCTDKICTSVCDGQNWPTTYKILSKCVMYSDS